MEEEICRLIDEQLSLIMELKVAKEELTAFQSKPAVDKKAMRKNLTQEVT